MRILRRIAEWRAARKQDRADIARARAELARAGDEPSISLSDTVDNAAGTYPQF